MNYFLEMIKKRRSIRKYKDKKVEKEKIIRIIQSALLSPSGKNVNPWKFVIVEDEDILLKLSRAKTSGSQFLGKAPLAIVVLADPEESDIWIEDASIATTMIMLSAQDSGLGSCWIQIRNRMHPDNIESEKYVKKILDIPDNIVVLCMIAIGYPDELKTEKSIDDKKWNDVFVNTFGNKIVKQNIK